MWLWDRFPSQEKRDTGAFSEGIRGVYTFGVELQKTPLVYYDSVSGHDFTFHLLVCVLRSDDPKFLISDFSDRVSEIVYLQS